MDFSIKKPAHILALLAILFVFFILYVMPALSLLNLLPSTEGKELTEPVILLSSVITVLIFIGAPLSWYLLVNKCSIKEMLHHLKLRAEGMDAAFLWGVVVAAVMIALMIVLGVLLNNMGVSQGDQSNIEDIARNISIASMFLIIVFQSIAEEIFFRGFLLEKIESIAGGIMAIFITAILFGLAHMSYGKIYPVVMPIIMGVFLGFVVFKTKNLYSAITAHMLFNLTSFILYIFAKSLS
jgi:membrane protease YdiL (CAAX protease family)